MGLFDAVDDKEEKENKDKDSSLEGKSEKYKEIWAPYEEFDLELRDKDSPIRPMDCVDCSEGTSYHVLGIKGAVKGTSLSICSNAQCERSAFNKDVVQRAPLEQVIYIHRRIQEREAE